MGLAVCRRCAGLLKLFGSDANVVQALRDCLRITMSPCAPCLLLLVGFCSYVRLD